MLTHAKKRLKNRQFWTLLSALVAIILLVGCQSKPADKGKVSKQVNTELPKVKVPKLSLKEVKMSETPFFDINPESDSDLKKKADQETQVKELTNAVAEITDERGAKNLTQTGNDEIGYVTLPKTMMLKSDKKVAILKDSKTDVAIIAQTYPADEFESINDLASQLYGGFVSQYGELEQLNAMAYYIESTQTNNREFAFSVTSKGKKELDYTIIIIDDDKGSYHVFSISGTKPEDNTSDDFNTNVSDIYYLIAGTFKSNKDE
ncbi:hypothetical protein RyT2_04020 [Pseudolactococcus yaeyamensis]